MSIFALLRNSRHILELKDTIHKEVSNHMYYFSPVPQL